MNEEELKNGQMPTEEAVTTPVEAEKPRGRKAMRGRMAEKYPDRNWDESTEGYEDDDAMADQAMKDYDELDGQMKQRDEADAKLADLFDKNPQSAGFLMGMARGEDFVTNLYNNFGEDIVEAMSDPEKAAELAKKNQENIKKAAADKEMADKREQNYIKSLETLATCQEEEGLSDDDVQEGMDDLSRIVDEYLNGVITPETVKMFIKGKRHDMDVAEASRKGEVAGRNANIEEKLRKSRKQTDGAPSLGGQSTNARGREFTQKTGMGTGSDIWAKGGFKRNTYN